MFSHRIHPAGFLRQGGAMKYSNEDKPPLRWPKSKDQCWYRNVPYDWINSQKSNQHWLAKDGDRFRFPGGGTMFPNGVGAYVDAMRALIPGMRDGTVRTALDTGCGVASWGGDLLARGILTVSLAPRDNHEAQVQFALERGIPAILGIISTQRLSFPSAAFDMAHCSRCLIPWTEFGGLYLLEIHRVLRPGGFWVLSGPPTYYENRWHGWNTTAQAQKADLDRLKKMLAAIVDPDAAWYVPVRPCFTAPSARYKKLGNSTPKWPQRLTIAPERINVVPGGSAGAFKQDCRTTPSGSSGPSTTRRCCQRSGPTRSGTSWT
ncbi:hypothetical protein PVAP13_9NG376642 [Panicum virgatum]|uniref:Methyltransferase n=1 Tax=Panicum virgatum TaxID=38727 RepID=A0A8T0MVG5_PANVG|nr:hypothetical protein PVAP13_9NG376642 [Panicum virgatum]